MSALWTSQDASIATGGRATCDFAVSGISIDTRSLQKGDLFVALAAARDGHDFVAQALEKGAAAALVSHIPEGLDESAPLLIVADVLTALEDLGRAARARTNARVVAITGSVGKTSTKEMLRAMLGGQGRTHAAEASYNNHWGVPLTLARMPKDCDFAVIEIGMSNPGEIAPLAMMARPDVAMVTIVAAAHMASFGSLDGIAEEKAAIFNGLVKGGTAIVNADLATSPILLARAQEAGAQIVTFGESDQAQWHLKSFRLADETAVAQLDYPKSDLRETLVFRLASPGRHFVLNAIGALAAVEALGADPVLAVHDLGRWAPPSGRGTRERIVIDPIDETFFNLIDDSFNANPTSLAASLNVLIAAKPIDGVGVRGAGRRIAVLGDMLELGEDELSLHADVAKHPGLEAIALIHCVGPRMQALYQALPLQQRGEWFETAAELAPKVRTMIDPGDIVLVKGSKGSKVSLIAEALRKLGVKSETNEGTE